MLNHSDLLSLLGGTPQPNVRLARTPSRCGGGPSAFLWCFSQPLQTTGLFADSSSTRSPGSRAQFVAGLGRVWLCVWSGGDNGCAKGGGAIRGPGAVPSCRLTLLCRCALPAWWFTRHNSVAAW